MKRLRVLVVVAVLALGFALQIYFSSSYPQPILFGDPGAYYVVGQKLQQAVERLRAGDDIATVYESVRGVLYFAGVGSVYGIIDSLSPQNIPYFRAVLSVFNTLTMLGCFYLAQRLSGSYWGGLTALVLSAMYPPFSVQTGRLFPDPITGCLFVWSAYFYLRGIQDRSNGFMFASGLALTGALFIRSQLFNYVIVLLLITVAATALWWWRDQRRLVAALLIGSLPFTMLWLGIVRSVGDDVEEIQAFGNFTFKKQYPYGFWQFLDSDGWMGPYRLRQEPYYRAMEAKAEDDPGLLESYPRQLAFTARYVVSRPTESIAVVLDNVLRLYDRPANDYKWDYPFSYSTQVIYQRLLVVLSVVGFVVVTSRHPSRVFVFFVPACLALLHGLSYPWPRFNQPAMPILIAVAGAAAYWGWCRRPRRWRPLILAAVASAFLFTLGALLRVSLPELTRVSFAVGRIAFLAIPFVFVAFCVCENDRRACVLAAGAWLSLALLVTVHDLRSPSWHETSVRLGKARQQIALSHEALREISGGSEAFAVFDLHIPDGDPSGVSVSINGHDVSTELVPTMPRFGESTAAGGRNRREYRQWWAVPLRADLLPPSAPARLELKVSATERTDVVLYGDRFRDQDRFYEGPSFGDWPHLAQVKLEYDGDYRLPVRVPLASARTEADTASVHRMRVITLSSNEGRLVWESEPVSAGGPRALAFFAYSGNRGEAEIAVSGQSLATFPLGSMDDFDIDGLCHRAEPARGGMAYGGYVVFIDAVEDGPVTMSVRFRSGMSIEPMFLSLDQRNDDLSELVSRCGREDVPIAGLSRIVEAETNSYPADTGRWSVASVF